MRVGGAIGLGNGEPPPALIRAGEAWVARPFSTSARDGRNTWPPHWTACVDGPPPGGAGGKARRSPARSPVAIAARPSGGAAGAVGGARRGAPHGAHVALAAARGGCRGGGGGRH